MVFAVEVEPRMIFWDLAKSSTEILVQDLRTTRVQHALFATSEKCNVVITINIVNSLSTR